MKPSIDKNIRALNAQFKQPPDVIAISRQDYEFELREAPWTLWAPLDETTVAHPYDAALESHLVEHAIYFRCGPALPHCQPTVVTGSKPSSAGSTRRGHGLTARSKPPSSKASSCSCRCSTTTPPCTARSVRRAKCYAKPAGERPAATAPAARRAARERAGAGPELSRSR